MRNRTIARELAIQALYQIDLRSDEIIDEIDTFCKNSTEKQDIYTFAISLVNGCRTHIKEIDGKISPLQSIGNCIAWLLLTKIFCV